MVCGSSFGAGNNSRAAKRSAAAVAATASVAAAVVMVLCVAALPTARAQCQGTPNRGFYKQCMINAPAVNGGGPHWFPYGTNTTNNDTLVMPRQDDGYAYVNTATYGSGGGPASWGFYNQLYNGFFVGFNGYIGFSNGVPAYVYGDLPITPAQASFIAVYFADADPIASPPGNAAANAPNSPTAFQPTYGLMYRVRSRFGSLPINNASEVNACGNAVRTSYLGQSGYNAQWCAIVTWDHIGPFVGGSFGWNSTANLINAYQAVMVSDGSSTYVLFHYGSLGNWWQQTAGMKANGNVFPIIGFDAGDGVTKFSPPRFLPRAGGAATAFSFLTGNTNIPPNSAAGMLPYNGRYIWKISEGIIRDPPSELSNNANLIYLNQTCPGSAFTPPFDATSATNLYNLIVNPGACNSGFYIYAASNDTQASMYVNGIRTANYVPTQFVVTTTTVISISIVSVLGPSRTYTILADVRKSPISTLSNIAVSGGGAGALSPGMPVGTNRFYTISALSANIAAIAIGTATTEANAQVIIYKANTQIVIAGPTPGGANAAAGSFSLNYAPAVSPSQTLMILNVTAADNVNKTQYFITFNVQYSSDASLSSFTVSPPYTVNVAGSTRSWTVSPDDITSTVSVTSTYPQAILTLDGTVSGPGSVFKQIPLAFGTNNYNLQIVAENTQLPATQYPMIITRPKYTNANIVYFNLTTDKGAVLGPFLMSAFSGSAPNYAITRAVPYDTISVRVTVSLSETTYARATMGGPLINLQPSNAQTLTTDPLNGANTVLTVTVTAHDTSVVNQFAISVSKPAVPAYTLQAGACLSLPSDAMTNVDAHSARFTVPAGVDALTVDTNSTVAASAAQLYLRKSALPVLSGATAWDAQSPNPVSGAVYASLAFMNPANANDYYLSWTLPSAAASTRVAITVCANTAQVLTLNGAAVASATMLQRNRWNFYEYAMPSNFNPASVIFSLNVPATQAQSAQYFQTFANAGATAADAADYFGAIVPGNNPALQGATYYYTATDVAPGPSVTVFFGVFTVPEGAGLPALQPKYASTVQVATPVPIITLVNPLAGPTAGTTALVITCTNCEPIASGNSAAGSGAVVKVGPNTATGLAYDASGRLTVNAPAGEGIANWITVAMYGQTSAPFNSPYVYTAPQITQDLNPLGGPTVGTNSLVITGTNLGVTGNVTVGGVNCPVTARTPHTSITCTVPPGQGSAQVLVYVNGQYNIGAQYYYQYDAPVPYSYTAANIATTGGNALTIFGYNFGTPSATVSITVGGGNCPPIMAQSNHTKLVCTLPPGAGQSQTIAITVNGKTNSVFLGFTYAAPTLTYVGPNPFDPQGGNVLLIGTNLGPAAVTPLSINLLGGQCSLITKNHTHILCAAPVRTAGLPVDPYVIVASQPSNSLAGFKYRDPVINSLSAYTASTDGTTQIVITGLNFFTSAVTDISVTLNTAVQCQVLTPSTTPTGPAPTNTAVTVRIPAGFGVNLPLQLSVGGLFSNSVAFNYSAPIVSRVTPQPRTDGTTQVVIGGINFATTGSVLVSNGGTCTASFWNTTTVMCTFPPGVGTVTLQVVVGSVPSNSFAVTYQPPVLSLIQPVAGVTTAGTDAITITGQNFGPSTELTSSSFVDVKIGNGQFVACPRVTWSDLSVLCTAPAGNGTNLQVRMTVKGQVASISTLNYRGPAITNAVAPSYPTNGGTALQITGTSLDSGGRVTVNGSVCVTQSWSNTLNSITCTLPIGGGANVPVVVTTSFGLVSAAFPITYTSPSIAQIVPNSLSTMGQTVLVRGSNLGANLLLASVAVSTTSGGHTITFANHTHAYFTLGSTPSSSTPTITWTYAGLSSAAATVGVDPPVISLLTPANGPTGPAYNLTLTGTGFGDGTRPTVVFVGSKQAAAPLLITAGKVIVLMPSGGVGPQQPVSISVGTSTSNNYMFNFDRPTVTYASPRANLTTAGSQSVLVLGTSFSEFPTAFIGSTACLTTTALNDSALICITPPGVAQNQTVTVQVGSQTSVEQTVRVSYAYPVITGLSPSTYSTSGCTTGCFQVQGTGFGPAGTNGIVKVGSATCAYLTAGYSDGAISCNLPAGVGAGVPVQVTVNGIGSNLWPFNYAPPIITSVGPAAVRPNTIGGTVVTLFGSDFGPTVGSVVINGTATCTVQAPSDWQTGSIVCTTPAFAGWVTVTVTVGSGQFQVTSAAFALQYAAPVIGPTALSPANGPTAGATALLISGSQFYVNGFGYVLVDGRLCPPSGTGWTQTRIECTVPAGAGGVVNVQVFVAGASSNTFQYTYDKPEVYAVQPGFGPTNAGTGGNPPSKIAIIGKNFGIPGSPLTATFGSGSATPVNCASFANNHTHIICDSVPNGVGAGRNVQVTLNAQASPTTNSPAPLFSYNVPVVNTITSTACTANGNTVINCNVNAGAGSLTLTGVDFGALSSTPGPVVTVDGATCANLAINAAGTQATCDLPALNINSFNVPVVINVGGQPSAPLYIAYAGPRLTTGTLQSVGTGQTGGTVTLAFDDTQPNRVLRFVGTFLNQFGSAGCVMRFGPASIVDPTLLPFVCTVNTATLSSTFVECEADEFALGSALKFAYFDSRQWSPYSVDTISYAAPAFVAQTLATTSGGAGQAGAVPTASPQGQDLYFDMNFVGNHAEALTIYYDVSGGAFNDPAKQCTGVAVDQAYNGVKTRITCRTQPGSGGPYFFKAIAYGAASAVSADSWNYPAQPVVYGVRSTGCTNNLQSQTVTNCPTLGGTPITINGTNFADGAGVKVGTADCVATSQTSLQIVCTLAAGTGLNLPITVFSAGILSNAVPLLSYRQANITRVTGCTNQPDDSTTACPRLGSIPITVIGTNFGKSGAQMFIGSKPCAGVVAHDLTNPDTVLTCSSLPPGVEVGQAVLVLQGTGELSIRSGLLSYSPCTAGTYQQSQVDYACTDCLPGFITDSVGQSSCKACPTGQYQQNSGQSFCNTCGSGAYAGSVGSTGCLPCAAKTASIALGASSCPACGSGKYANGTGNVLCSSCPAGQAYDGLTPSGGVTGCTNCTAGSYAGVVGTGTCSLCATGFVSNAGATACSACLPGYVQPTQGQQTCAFCATGRFQAFAGKDQCDQCTAGTFANNTASTTCDVCPSGKYSGNGATVCTACEVGKYNNKPGQGSCLFCPDGSYTNVQESKSCTLCAVGTYTGTSAGTTAWTQCTNCTIGWAAPVPGLSLCVPCDLGTYAFTSGQSTCAQCAAGKVAATTGLGFCSDCSASTIAATPGLAACTQCAAGAYQDQGGQSVCKRCAIGTYSDSGASGCTPCGAGFYTNTDNTATQAGCQQCDLGKYQPNPTAGTCLSCPLGTSSPLGAAACTNCTAGTYAQLIGTKQCTPCPAGMWQPLATQSSCQLCAAGTFSANPGATICATADPGSYVESPGLSQQTDCPSGRFSTGSAATCTNCVPGRYQPNPKQSDCIDCGAGTATSAEGTVTCPPCPTGTSQLQTGKLTCDPCEAGASAPVEGLSQCAKCVPGRAVSATGANDCVDCQPGTFQVNSGRLNCTRCPAGTKQPASAGQTCINCLAGTWSADGASDCTQCLPGTYAAGSNAVACDLCPPGYAAGALGASNCAPCATGKFAAGFSNALCTDCAAGKFASNGTSASCDLCPAGTFLADGGKSVCSNCTAGSFSSGAGSLGCTQCPAGSYAPRDGLSACLPCPFGAKCPAGSVNPTLCPKGSYGPSTSQDFCPTCTAGYFTATDGLALCSECPAGQYQGADNAITCLPCDLGKASADPHRAACDPCPSGTFANNTGFQYCTQCSPGYAQPNSNAQSCVACGTLAQAGRFSSGFASVDCTDCQVGTIANVIGGSAASCVACAPGTVAPTVKSSTCTPCAQGKYVTASGQGVCVDCDSGSFGNTTGLSACYACNLGSYSVKNTALGHGPYSCATCPAGKYANQFGQTACLDCPLGTANPYTGQTVCGLCAPGSAQGAPGQSSSCPLCAPGSIAPNNGSIQCSSCPPGFYAGDAGLTTCTACAVGTYFNSSGAGACNACPAGSYAPTTGSINCVACDVGKFTQYSRQGNCSSCPIGTANSYSGQAQCTACVPGYYAQEIGQVQCAACPSGSAATGSGNSQCTLCSAGYYMGSSGQPACLPCAPGYFSANPGALACIQCPAGSASNGSLGVCAPCPIGTFAANLGQSECTPCAPGSYTDILGQTECAPCQRGSAQSSYGMTTCFACDPGTSQPSIGQPNCVNCAPGSATSFRGMASCDACAKGKYADIPGLTACVNCEAGTYGPTGSLSACLNCTAFPVATYQPSTGGVVCPLCPAGKYQTAPGQAACVDCAPGTYSFNDGQLSCDLCPNGTASSVPGQRVCLGCSAGTFANQTGLQNCFPCDIGKFQGAQAQTACTRCDRGTFTDQTGQPKCGACAVGKWNNDYGRTVCDNCQAGRYNDETTSRTTCAVCDLGTYAPEPGSANCLLCQPGSAINKNGSDHCDACSPGSAQQTAGAPTCQLCDAKEYAPGNGSRVCTRCPAGTANNLPGQTACEPCAPGYEQPAESQAQCKPCAIGYYTNFTNTVNCPPCTAGRYTNRNASVECPSCPAGKSQKDTGRSFCADCGIGTFAISGAIGCDKCPIGTAAPNGGASSCYSCPANGQSQTNGAQCYCDADYAALFFYDRSAGYVKIQCERCPEGAVCDQPGTIWDSMKTRSGYWAPYVGTYYKCFLETQCVGGDAPADPHNPWGQSYGPDLLAWRNTTTNQIIAYFNATDSQANSPPPGVTVEVAAMPSPYSPLPPAPITGDNYGVQASQCAANRGYVLCSLCNPGYTETIGSECRLCPATQAYSYVLTAGMMLIFLACLFLAFYLILESGTELMQVAMREDEKMARQKLGYVEDFADDFMALRFRHGRIITVKGPPAPKPDFTFKLKIVLGFVQIMSILAITLDIRWPTRFKQFVSVFSPTNLDFVKFASVDCITQGYNYYSRLILFSLAPPILIGLIVILYYVPMTLRYDRSTREGKTQRKRVRRNFWKLVQFALFLLYPNVSSVVLRVYVCTKIGETRYLQADFTIECDTDTWRAAAYVSVIMIGAYVVGIPLLFALALFRYRKRLDESGIRAQYGFLYDAYERPFYFFELCDMIHKLAVTSLIAFLPFHMQLPGATIIVVLFLMILLLGRPYLRKGDDKLHVFAQIEICLGVIAGNVLNTLGDVSDAYDTAMSVCLIFICCVFFLYFLAGALSVLWKMFKATAFAQRFAFFRGDKKQRKKFAKNYFAAVLDDYKIDRNNLRRQPLGQKAGEDAGVRMARNPLFMAGGSAGTALVDEHDQTVVEVMVNPLLLDKVREAVEEKARLDAQAAAEAEKRRLAREAELKKQREDEELAEKQYQDLLMKAQNANEEEAKALREQAAALKERHDSPMRIDDVFFTAADPLAADQGAIKAEFAPSGADVAAAAGGTGAAPSGADLLLDPTLLGAGGAASAAPVSDSGAAAAAPAANVDLSGLSGIGTLGGDAAPGDAAAAAAPADAAAAAPAEAPVSVALPDLGTLDMGLGSLGGDDAKKPGDADGGAAVPERARHTTRSKKEKEID